MHLDSMYCTIIFAVIDNPRKGFVDSFIVFTNRERFVHDTKTAIFTEIADNVSRVVILTESASIDA